MSLNSFVQHSVEQLEDDGFDVSQRRVNLMAGKGAELKYHCWIVITSINTAVPLVVTQYVIVWREDAYVISLETLTYQAEAYVPLFEKIASSF
jgi:hypothetical protein